MNFRVHMFLSYEKSWGLWPHLCLWNCCLKRQWEEILEWHPVHHSASNNTLSNILVSLTSNSFAFWAQQYLFKCWTGWVIEACRPVLLGLNNQWKFSEKRKRNTKNENYFKRERERESERKGGRRALIKDKVAFKMTLFLKPICKPPLIVFRLYCLLGSYLLNLQVSTICKLLKVTFEWNRICLYFNFQQLKTWES